MNEKNEKFLKISKDLSESKPMKARLIGTIFEISIGILFCGIMLGKVALPAFYAVSTSGFDAYTLLIWGLLPLVATVAVATAVYDRAKFAYQIIRGGPTGY
jgi:hypothetical protein